MVSVFLPDKEKKAQKKIDSCVGQMTCFDCPMIVVALCSSALLDSDVNISIDAIDFISYQAMTTDSGIFRTVLVKSRLSSLPSDQGILTVQYKL